jgi:hypothetical protein
MKKLIKVSSTIIYNHIQFIGLIKNETREAKPSLKSCPSPSVTFQQKWLPLTLIFAYKTHKHING